MSFLHRIIVIFILFFGASTVGFAEWPIKEVITPTGLKFFHLFQPEEKTQSMAFAWRDGTALSAPGKEAVVMIGTSLLREGTKQIEAGELEENLKDLQAGFAFGARNNYLTGYVQAPVANVSATFKALNEVLVTPRFADSNFRRLREQYVNSAKQSVENPQAIAARIYARIHTGEGQHFSFMSGSTPAALQAVQKSDIEDWHRSIIARSNLIIVVSGPLAVEAAITEVERAFTGLPEKSTLPQYGKLDLRMPARTIVLERDVKQSIVIGGGPAGFSGGPEYYARITAMAVLTGGSGTSRLYTGLREKLGSTYGASAQLDQIDPHNTLMSMSTSVDNNLVVASIDALKSEYTKFRRDGVTQDEIDARRSASKTYLEEVMRKAGASDRIRDDIINGRNFDYVNRVLRFMEILTVMRVNNAIKDRLPRDPLSFVIVTPTAKGIAADCVIKSEAELSRCFP